MPITILKSIDHNLELEQDLEVDNRRLSIIVSNSDRIAQFEMCHSLEFSYL